MRWSVNQHTLVTASVKTHKVTEKQTNSQAWEAKQPKAHTYSLGKQRPGTKAGRPFFYRCELDHSQSAGVRALHVTYVCRCLLYGQPVILNYAYNAQRNGRNGLYQVLTHWILQVSTFFNHIGEKLPAEGNVASSTHFTLCFPFTTVTK